jgi:diamine N-acetyltransferase
MAACREAAFDAAKQAAELANRRGVFLMAEVGAQAADYARLKEGAPPGEATGERPIEIVRLYGMQEWIGRGVGAAPIAVCLAEAERRGCDAVWLDVWQHNPRARAFYARWGFEEVSRQAFRLADELQSDLVLQRRVLPSPPGTI